MTKLGDISGLQKLNYSNREALFQELCDVWKCRNAFITARCISKKGKLYLVNLTNHKGDKLKYPNGGKVEMIPVDKGLNLRPSHYKFKFRLADDQTRNRLRNEYLIEIDPEYKPRYQKSNSKSQSHSSKEKAHVAEIKRDYESGSARLIKLSSNMIRSIVTETNKKPETFIFELIQNANDNHDPDREGVKIEFHIIQDYLVMVHDGLTFRDNNVEAICGVDQGDKKFDLEKVGYKGMGFKSIFKFANYVWINSGNYSFRFDANYERIKKETPWQVIPIWTEPNDQDNALKPLLNHPVTIAIKFKQGVEKLRELMEVFESVFKSDSRLLLFLRNVNSIKFNGFDETFAIQKSSSLWKVSDLPEISLDESTYSKLRFDADNDDRVPEKYKTLRKTKISFAAAHENNEIKVLEQTRLFAYLPTDLNFGFNFLINGDFIPDGSRDRLFVDIDFNLFLMRKAGYQFISWIADLVKEVNNTSPYDLIPDIEQLINSEHDESKITLLNEFKKGFDQAIEEIAFILCTNNNLELLSNIIIDKTGVAGILGAEVFKSRFDIAKEAIHTGISDTRWIQKLLKAKEFNEGIFEWEDLIDNFSNISEELKPVEANAKFLNLLAVNGKIENFKDLPIALSRKDELTNFQVLYKDVPEEHLEIVSWLGANWIHREVSANIKEEASSLLRSFNAFDFIQSNVIGNINNVNDCIKNDYFSKRIFAFVKENINELTRSSIESLKKIYFIDENESVVQGFEKQPNYLPHSYLKEIIDLKCFPENHFSIISHSYEDSNLYDLFKQYFGVIDYEASNVGEFLLKNVVGKIESINSHLEQLENEDFIKASTFLLEQFSKAKEFLNDSQKNSLISDFSKLKVLTKTGAKVEVNICYISGEYTGHSEVEDLIDDFDIDVLFISGNYLEKGSLNKTEWRSIFKDLGCKSDHLNFIKDTLLPRINNLEREKLIKATRLIFDKRSKLENELSSMSAFPVATRAENLKSSEVSFNSKMLNVDSVIGELWECFPLENEIDESYFDSLTNQWTDFFVSVGVPQPENDYPVTNLIEKIVETVFDDVEHHLKTFNLLCNLYEQEKLSEEHLLNLGALKLLSENEVYEVANDLFLSKSYNPKVDFKAYASNDITVISDKYLNSEISSQVVKKFLNAIGLTESFKVVFSKRVYRKDLPDWFVSYVDNKDSYIKSNARSWGHQHYVGYPDSVSSDRGYNQVLHLQLISNIEINAVFWELITESSYFRNQAFSEVFYRCFNRKLPLPGYLAVYLDKNKLVPNLSNDLCFANELYSNSIRDILKDNNIICKLDISNVLVGEHKLENILGIRSELDLEGV